MINASLMKIMQTHTNSLYYLIANIPFKSISFLCGSEARGTKWLMFSVFILKSEYRISLLMKLPHSLFLDDKYSR